MSSAYRIWLNSTQQNYLWSKIHYEIKDLKRKGKVRAYKNWLYDPSRYKTINPSVIKNIYNRRKKVYDDWAKAATRGGYHLKDLVGTYLTQNGVQMSPDTVTWNNTRLRIDLKNTTTAILVKNVLSDVFYDPNSLSSINAGHTKIKNVFEYCSHHSLQPILIAPLIHDSFYTFAAQHNGLFCRTYLQLLTAHQRSLRTKINHEFNIGIIRATNTLPYTIKQWINNHII